MSNGLYNGLENGLHKGEFNGQRNGLENGMFENETVIKKEVIQQGLQLYLDFSNPRCYNYGQGQVGNTVYNLSKQLREIGKGGGGNLIIGNTTGRAVANAPYVDYNPIATWNNYTLDGQGRNYLGSPNNTDFDIGLGAGFTISMWIKVVSSTPDYNLVFGKTIAGSVANRYYFATRTNGVFNFLIQIDVNSEINTAVNTYTVGKWCYLTATYERDAGIKLYVDNVLVGSAATTQTVSNLTVNAQYRIGSHSGGIFPDNHGRFEMNYYTHYNRPLSASERTYNYNTTKQFMKL